MEIGGYDLQITGQTNNKEFELIIRYILSHWPKAIFQNANQHITQAITDNFFPAEPVKEFFIFCDQKNSDLWGKYGLTKFNADKVINFFFESDGIAVVVEAPGSETHKMVMGLETVLKQNRSGRS